jgi:hypothetical protein
MRFCLTWTFTSTAKLHAAAWKQTFDTLLQRRAETRNEASFSSISATTIANTLMETALRRCTKLSNVSWNRFTLWSASRSSHLVNQIVAREGIAAYPGSVKAVKYLRENGYKTAVVSSSENCAAVLKAAAIESLVDVRVDGNSASFLQCSCWEHTHAHQSRNLTDKQWKSLGPLIPEPIKRRDGRGRPWKSRRSVMNGILWGLRTGAP